MAMKRDWNSAIRVLTPADAQRITDHLQRLDRSARRSRFGGNVSNHFLASYANMPRGYHTAALGCFEDDVLVGLGQLTILDTSHTDCAEAAMTVDRAWRDRGIGTALLARLAHLAADASAHRLRLLCVPLNLRLIHVARKFGADLKSHSGDLLLEFPLLPTGSKDVSDATGSERLGS
jgi:RimJ/RimL family protein N-acetyltransferase